MKLSQTWKNCVKCRLHGKLFSLRGKQNKPILFITIRDNGEWDRLPTAERAQNQGFMQHTGMAARFGNILGKDTIGTLEHLTSKITIVFTHSTMVDRVAAMLNYFLYNLVGPKKKNFKVRETTSPRLKFQKTSLTCKRQMQCLI